MPFTTKYCPGCEHPLKHHGICCHNKTCICILSHGEIEKGLSQARIYEEKQKIKRWRLDRKNRLRRQRDAKKKRVQK